jgi:hypothetical protein
MADPGGGLFSSDYMPHGHCYLWETPLVVVQVAANLSIGLAYLTISATLAFLVRRVRDLPFQWVYLAFGLFIVTCGFTHFMDVWVVWRPNYWVDAWIRVVCAIASVGTAVLLPPLVPKAVSLARAARQVHERGLRLEQLNVELSALYEKTRETIAEAIPHLVWTAAPDGALDYVNPQWIAYVGARTLGWDWQSRVAPEDLGALLDRWRQSLVTGEPYEMECRIRREDGEHRWFLVRALPLRAGAKIVRWFGTCTDIHDRKLLDEERQRALARAREEVRARDVFLAIAAHELRTPLTPLRFELDGLARSVAAGRVSPDRLAPRVALAARQLERLSRLVESLLDVSRLTTGHFQLQREEVDLAALAREVAARHAPEIAAAGCALTLGADAPATGSWDRLRLDEVVTNLLLNAVTYSRGKPVAIEIQPGEAAAVLFVRDEGEGIKPEDQARIFERFERATLERHAGGLGLAIVEAHGGTVQVESRPGEGSLFTVTLPRRPPEPTGRA